MKPAAPSPVLRATRLLDQVRERIRYKHYSLRTEQAYVQWVRTFVKWHGLRHPRDMGREEIESFLAMLANERRVGGQSLRKSSAASKPCAGILATRAAVTATACAPILDQPSPRLP